MLFVFETVKPRRYLLHVSNRTMTRHVIDLEGLQEVLSGFIELPEGDLELREMCTIEKVTILMWSFSEYVGCRNVGRYQFVYVNTEDRLYEFNEPCTKH